MGEAELARTDITVGIGEEAFTTLRDVSELPKDEAAAVMLERAISCDAFASQILSVGLFLESVDQRGLGVILDKFIQGDTESIDNIVTDLHDRSLELRKLAIEVRARDVEAVLGSYCTRATLKSAIDPETQQATTRKPSIIDIDRFIDDFTALEAVNSSPDTALDCESDFAIWKPVLESSGTNTYDEELVFNHIDGILDEKNEREGIGKLGGLVRRAKAHLGLGITQVAVFFPEAEKYKDRALSYVSRLDGLNDTQFAHEPKPGTKIERQIYKAYRYDRKAYDRFSFQLREEVKVPPEVVFFQR